MLCGENGSVDITDFLDQSIKGPASFSCLQQTGGNNDCQFKEPEMDKLIQMMFGDSSIFIDCQAGECLYETEVPGYERPVKKNQHPSYSCSHRRCLIVRRCCYSHGMVPIEKAVQIWPDSSG